MSIYSCPVCGNELIKEDKRYVCEKNHSFDIAKEGYVNLLLANQKKSTDPGDNKQMIISRRDFLNLGHYDPISNALNEQISKLVALHEEDFKLLDVGCGEGFFLWKLRQYLSNNNPQANSNFYGMDISKSGIKSASKRDKQSHFSIASLYQLPFHDNSLHCLTRIFAPKSYAEFARVLQAKAKFISIVPGPEHLMALKEIIYQNPKPHEQIDDSECEQFFVLHEQIRVKYSISLVGENNISNLIKMTPYYWHMPKEASDIFERLSQLDVGIDCLVNIYEKRLEA